MRRRLVFCALLCATILSGSAFAADTSLVGKWVSEGAGRKVQMTFTAEGQCHMAITEKGKTSHLSGPYHVADGKLIIHPKDEKPIHYTMTRNGDTLTLSNGWFAGKAPLTLTRQAGTAMAPPAQQPGNDAPKAGTPNNPQPNNPQPNPPAANANPGNLPGGAWDTAGMEQMFTILRTDYDANTNKVTWLLQKNVDQYVTLNIAFYDQDGVKLGTDYITFDPAISAVAKGERTRASATMLKPDDMKKVVKVVVTHM